MQWSQLAIPGAWLIEPEKLHDERGFFARVLDRDELREHGLVDVFDQESIAFNTLSGTVRGIHVQRPPYAEAKLIRCIRGAVHDVVVDVRPESATYGTIATVLLDAVNRAILYVPPGIAHGYQTLADETELWYALAPRFNAAAADGFRWDDPSVGISWPLPISMISEGDRHRSTLAALTARWHDPIGVSGELHA